jgi:hypothetical protein
MQNVKTAVGHHQLLTALFDLLSPRGELAGFNEFIPEIHSVSLPLTAAFANSKRRLLSVTVPWTRTRVKDSGPPVRRFLRFPNRTKAANLPDNNYGRSDSLP